MFESLNIVIFSDETAERLERLKVQIPDGSNGFSKQG